jgi:hypothetical protein
VRIKSIKEGDMTKELFLSVAETYYDEFSSLPEASNFYDYGC